MAMFASHKILNQFTLYLRDLSPLSQVPVQESYEGCMTVDPVRDIILYEVQMFYGLYHLLEG